MSNKELDNLFRNKLGDMEKSPASSLWDRIDEKIEQPKKRSPWVYLSIAASLLLLISFSYLFLNNEGTNNNDQRVIASNTPESSDSSSNESKAENIENNSSISNSEMVENDPIKETIEEKAVEQKPNTEAKPKEIIQLPSNRELTASNETKNDAATIEKHETKEVPTTIKIDEITDNTAIVAQNSTPDATNEVEAASEDKNSKSGQTLVFDISQFENSKTAVASAETDKKESTLLQIFNKAKEIKQGESGLGEIRAAKNSLLAFNGKKEGK